MTEAHDYHVDTLDRFIHEPARLMIVALLYSVERADFLYLQRETGLTKGNLSAQLSKLEQVGYVRIEKTFRGKMPLTVCSLTAEGRQAFEQYRTRLQQLMAATQQPGLSPG
ncbi:MAG: transcriptional regulator [Roseiflexaceae bacterium]|nr:transcriptional regulator [Roseiflexaceae bacterium]